MCQKAGKKLKAKGYRATSHYVAIPIVWFAIQILTVLGISVAYLTVTHNALPSMGIAYVSSLLLAFFSSIWILNRIDKKPDLLTVNTPEPLLPAHQQISNNPEEGTA